MVVWSHLGFKICILKIHSPLLGLENWWIPPENEQQTHLKIDDLERRSGFLLGPVLFLGAFAVSFWGSVSFFFWGGLHKLLRHLAGRSWSWRIRRSWTFTTLRRMRCGPTQKTGWNHGVNFRSTIFFWERFLGRFVFEGIMDPNWNISVGVCRDVDSFWKKNDRFH